MIVIIIDHKLCNVYQFGDCKERENLQKNFIAIAIILRFNIVKNRLMKFIASADSFIIQIIDIYIFNILLQLFIV